MTRWLVLAAVGLMLAVPAVAGASYTQPGGGPERTGAIDFPGPRTNDTAFQVDVPGVPIGQPAVIDGHAHLFTVGADSLFFGFAGPLDGETENLTESALWRVELATASVDRVMEIPDGLFPLPDVISAQQIFLTDFSTGELVALEVPTGQELWRVKALPNDPRGFRLYVGSAVQGETLYVAFAATGAGQDPEDPNMALFAATFETDLILGILAVDLASGQERWTWTHTIDPPGAGTGELGIRGVSEFTPSGVAVAADEQRVYAYLGLNRDTSVGGSAEGQWVNIDADRRVFELRALGAGNGASLWAVNDTERNEIGPETSQGSFQHDTVTGWTCCAYPVVTPESVHIRLDAFEARNPATGGEVWTSEGGQSDHIDTQGSTGMGIRGDAVIASTPQTVYRLDKLTGDIAWQHTVQGYLFSNAPVTIDEDTAYVPVGRLGDDCFVDLGMEARDLSTGEITWRWWYGPTVGIDDCGTNNRFSDPTFGPGVMVYPANDGTVNVLGQTDASLGAPPVDTELYPPEGEPFTVEVPEPEPGAFGPATRFKVDWGDGTVSNWQESPVFTHTYEDGVEHTARVMAGNDANQTSSTFVTMNVGQQAPTEPNWISERFAPENQDMTFGILGIAVAATGGAIGATQRYRKRSRLQDELEAIDEAYEATKERPMECEAQLNERKAYARGLVLNGELEEQQFGVIEKRIEELLRGIRMGAMDDEFDFLPYGLVKRAREMLADGTVSSLEREAFLQAVAEDDVLSSQQKAAVRERIEAWHARDRQGGGS